MNKPLPKSEEREAKRSSKPEALARQGGGERERERERESKEEWK